MTNNTQLPAPSPVTMRQQVLDALAANGKNRSTASTAEDALLDMASEMDRLAAELVDGATNIGDAMTRFAASTKKAGAARAGTSTPLDVSSIATFRDNAAKLGVLQRMFPPMFEALMGRGVK